MSEHGSGRHLDEPLPALAALSVLLVTGLIYVRLARQIARRAAALTPALFSVPIAMVWMAIR